MKYIRRKYGNRRTCEQTVSLTQKNARDSGKQHSVYEKEECKEKREMFGAVKVLLRIPCILFSLI